MTSATNKPKCEFYGRFCMNNADGQVQDIDGKIKDVCVKCAWRLYDEVDGNVEVVETL